GSMVTCCSADRRRIGEGRFGRAERTGVAARGDHDHRTPDRRRPFWRMPANVDAPNPVASLEARTLPTAMDNPGAHPQLTVTKRGPAVRTSRCAYPKRARPRDGGRPPALVPSALVPMPVVLECRS